MTNFLLIRHGRTDAIDHEFSGRTPGVLLNERGRFEAQRLAERMENIPVAAIYCSPLERAAETAKAVAANRNMPILPNEAFTEIDCGEWTGRPFDEIKNEPQFNRFNVFRSCSRPPGGELMLEVQARMISGLEKLLSRHPGETVVVVSHSDPIKSAIAYYSGIPMDLAHRLEIGLASVSAIEIGFEAARIHFINNSGELSGNF